MKMNRWKRNRSTGGFSMMKTKVSPLEWQLTVEVDVRGETEATREKTGGEEKFQIIQWLNSTKLFFLTESSKMEKIYIHNIKKWKQLFLPLLYIMWGLCDPPLVHGNMVIKSAWVTKKKKKKTALKPTSWSANWNKNSQKTRNSWRRDRAMARGYKIIKNSHVNNIIITRVTVICLKKYRRKW